MRIPQTTTPAGSRPGFTLVELMAVVLIVGVLAAILIPAASSVSAAARTTLERSAARGVVAGWRQWSLAHNGQLMPGQTDMATPLPSHEAPQVWNGTEIPEIARRRWIWRLVDYLDDASSMLWVNDQEAFHNNAIAHAANPADGVYLATLHPSLGLNTDFLGGRQSSACDTWALSEFIRAQDEGAQPLYSDSLARLRRPAELIAFASSRGPYNDSGADRIIEGFWRLSPPWKPAANGAAPRWTQTADGTFQMPDEQADPESVGGFLSPRHADGKVVVAAPDGHVAVESFEALGSMRRWSDDATGPQWAPSLP
ncbi:MAG: prepilin-type N-terminal cleavage/methylation domain-containing protein [Phycisphaerales bacterium]|jgi:prepilin-type N-terminal cleavage/methylation domain-containing protein|nr:prepilin-type N-terminal cleavage/methylation domain-containing protein [Phycisphaerales bacterium]